MGCQAQENIYHILQKCPGAHYPRIHRHNNVLRLLVKSLKLRRYKVLIEPCFLTAAGLCKLDILAIRESDNTAFIIDHIVVWDNGDLGRHFVEKELITAFINSITQLKIFLLVA